MTTTTTTTADLTATTACKCQQLFAVELADASENIMPTSSLLLSRLRCNRRRHLWRNGTRSYAIRLWWGPVFNVLAAAQCIATERASTRAAAVEISTADAAHAQQVFRLLAWRFVLFTREPSPAALCSGQMRRVPRDEAIMAYASLCLETPLAIRQMITGVTEMTRGNCITVEDANAWAHFKMRKKN